MTDISLNQIIKLINEGKYEDAGLGLKKLIQEDEKNLRYKNLLSIVLINKKENQMAIEVLETILDEDANYIDALINLGNLYNDMKNIAKANEYYKRALEIQPDNIALSNIFASNLIHMSKFEDAKKILNSILRQEPDNLNTLINLGVIEIENENYELAEKLFKKSLKINPNFYSAFYNLGLLEDKKNNIEFAIKHFLKSLSLNPKHAQSHYNLGCVYQQLGKIDEAYKSFEKALDINTNYIDAKINLSRLQLSKLEFKNGWQGYELRQGGVDKAYKILNVKKESIWDGLKYNGDIIVHGEQGLGDQVLFASLIKELEDYCTNLKVTIDKRLIDIMQRSFPKIEFFDKLEPVKITNHQTKNILLGSLPQYLRKNINSFREKQNSWLKLSQKKIDEVESSFKFSNKIKVGVSWKGGGISRVNREINTTDLFSIFDLTKYELVNLQHGNIEKDIGMSSKEIKNNFIYSKKFNYKDDLDGILALINKCDIVVTLGNTIAHLTGALGKKNFVLVAPNAQWYWLSEQREKLWYPNSEIFVAENNNSWLETLSKLKSRIHNYKKD